MSALWETSTSETKPLPEVGGCMVVLYDVEHRSTSIRGRFPIIQSVDRAARILKALSGGSRRLGVSDLSEQLGLAKGTVHGLLRTLRDHGLVEQDLESNKYQLGPALLELSNSYLDLNELRSRSLAWSELLAARTNEAVRVGAPHSHAVLVVHHVFRPDSSLQILEVGGVLPLHATALGKAVLAHLAPEVQAAIVAGALPKLTGQTLSTKAALERDLHLVQTRGYAVEKEEAIVGEAGIAAPIFDRQGGVIGAIGIAGPRERLLAKRREASLAGSVSEAARGISRDLGAVRWSAPG
jgi:DNA-binding IclR family transcriptional regulator